MKTIQQQLIENTNQRELERTVIADLESGLIAIDLHVSGLEYTKAVLEQAIRDAKDFYAKSVEAISELRARAKALGYKTSVIDSWIQIALGE